MPDRIDERAEIGRLLVSRRSIQMLAPRRVGKTWLMHRVAEDHRAKGWTTIFVDVEGMRHEDEFLRDLCRRIQENSPIEKSVFAHLGHRLRQLAVEGWEGNPMNALGRVDPKGFAEALVASLDAQGRETLILVDEIALFVMKRLAEDEAGTLDFLYHLRKLRQAYPRVRWLLTGSIGLDVVARREGLQGALVDLEIFPLEPFGAASARNYLERLCSNNDVRWPFALDDEAFAHLARELGWLAPFYLDLVANRIRPGGDNPTNGLRWARTQDIDRAFEELLRPDYRSHFGTWEEHIDKNFSEQDSTLLHDILDVCCETPAGEQFATLQARLAGTHQSLKPRDLKNHLSALANGGFLGEVEERWQFRSGLLRRYWQKYMHE